MAQENDQTILKHTNLEEELGAYCSSSSFLRLIMIVIDQFRISDDGMTLYLDAHVNKASYFDNVYIGGVTIVTDGQMKEFCLNAVDEAYIYKETYDTKGNAGKDRRKEIHLVLCPQVFNERFDGKNLSDNLFFVFIEATGMPSADTPCRLDEQYTIGVTFDYAMLLQKALGYLKELGDSCNIPMGLIDYILKFHALRSAIETEHWLPAIDYYYMLKDSGTSTADTGSTKPCGCHK